MDLVGIRAQLSLARVALGIDHPLSLRIVTVERHLTPGSPLWCTDAVSAESDLLALSTGLEQPPELMTPGPSETAEAARARTPPTVNVAMKHVEDASCRDRRCRGRIASLDEATRPAVIIVAGQGRFRLLNILSKIAIPR